MPPNPQRVAARFLVASEPEKPKKRWKVTIEDPDIHGGGQYTSFTVKEGPGLRKIDDVRWKYRKMKIVDVKVVKPVAASRPVQGAVWAPWGNERTALNWVWMNRPANASPSWLAVLGSVRDAFDGQGSGPRPAEMSAWEREGRSLDWHGAQPLLVQRKLGTLVQAMFDCYDIRGR
jgi:hypothetical protein